jgi:group II intron reverse transcriptase/maturase
MQNADAIVNIYRKRGSKGLPLERVYRHLFDPELFLRAYGKIYRNAGAMTKGSTAETVDGTSLQKIHAIIDRLKAERYRWEPVRRAYIAKQDGSGKKRPLGLPTWSDKLVQEAVRSLLEPYYEQRFSAHSHGFRPGRGCHTALREVVKTWKGTVWFIEGDIKGCFDNIDHSVLLQILRRDLHDGRLLNLLGGLLRAGYMEGWRHGDTLSGTPQGGILSPLLANIYLNELDRFVEDTLIPAYTKGERRQRNPAYDHLSRLLREARRRGDGDEAKRLRRARRELTSVAPQDPGYRRLRYLRYADDFLLGFVGPRKEADDIRQRLGEFLRQQLRLALSVEKTLITHATDAKAKFLGYELQVTRCASLVSENGKRAANGRIALLMPQKVVRSYRDRYSSHGKVIHRNSLLFDTDYTILQRYQGVLRGIYNYYCMAANVSKRMNRIRRILSTSLTKTLACKLRCRVSQVYRKYRVVVLDRVMLRVVIQRPGKEPLVAAFGGFPFERIPDGLGAKDFQFEPAWYAPGDKRAEVVQRLLVGKCELCGAEDAPVAVHHIRKLADIDRAGRRPKAAWEKRMAARKRKTLVVCANCHKDIHAGRYDGPSL